MAYHRLFVDTDLALPNVDLAPLKDFFLTDAIADELLTDLSAAAKSGGWTKQTNPVVDEIQVSKVSLESGSVLGTTTTCIINNHIAMDGGADGKDRTTDDVVISDGLETQRVEETWRFTTGKWRIDELVESTRSAGKIPCDG